MTLAMYDDAADRSGAHVSSRDRDQVTDAATDALLACPVPPPIRPRHVTSPAVVREMAEQLFARFNPAEPNRWRELLRRQLPHFYVPSVMKESRILFQLADTVTNGGRLFLHGTSPGVGAKMLATNYARAFNATAMQHGDHRRIASLMVGSGATSVKLLLDDISTMLRVRLSNTEYRRSPKMMILRILGAAARQNVSTIFISQLHKAAEPARAIIGDLLQATDPAYHVDLEFDPMQEQARRIGIVLVDYVRPEQLFRLNPDVLLLFENRVATLRHLNTEDEVAEAMRRADIGLEDLDVADADDLLMVQIVQRQTSGLVAQMTPLFELIAILSKAQHGARPSAGMVEAALPMHHRLITLKSTRGDVPGGKLYQVAARPLRVSTDDDDQQSGTGAGRLDDAPKDTGRTKALKMKGDARHRAVSEKRATQRRTHTTLFSTQD